ncbi:hypothetical protein P885DRAFT_69711 [Corynascus similis CBS 632.67]
MGLIHDAPSSTRYAVNTTLRIREHEPPQPFTGAYGPSPRPRADWSRWKGQNLWKIDRVDVEAWAYRTMQPVIGGTFVPAYYGSWTFAIGERWVRMILIELVQGECMLDIITRAEDKIGLTVDYARLPPEDFRIRVLKNIWEANLFIWWYAAVRHDDLAPRNVMVKPDGRVVIIDFNNVYIYDFTPKYDMHPRTRKQNPRPLPPSIIERLWPYPIGYKGDYPSWRPNGW